MFITLVITPVLKEERDPCMVQWLKLPAWEVGDHGVAPRSGIQVLKKHFFSSLVEIKYCGEPP